MEQENSIAQHVPTAMRGLTTPEYPRKSEPHEIQKFGEWLQFRINGDKELEKAVNAASVWARAMKFHMAPCWLSLIGTSGTGKTHIVKKLFEWAEGRFDTHKMEFTPIFIYWPKFVQQLRAGEGFRMRDDMIRWPVLCLDDVGSERDTTGFASEELNCLLNWRMDKWTLLTSNLDMDGVSKIDARIADRLIRPPNICAEVNTISFAAREEPNQNLPYADD